MTPESLLYLPLTLHIGSKIEKTYAPMLPTPLWADTDSGLAAYVLTQSSRSLHQGLYVMNGEHWQFTMPQPILSDILIKGSNVNVYLGINPSITVGTDATVFKNGIDFEPRVLDGGAVFCVITPEEVVDGSFTMRAAQALSGHRVIQATTGGANYASSDIQMSANAVVGISTGAAAAGTPVVIQTDGELTEPSWNWEVGKPLFCGINGALTQESPTSGFSLIVGIAIGPQTILISVKQPLVLN